MIVVSVNAEPVQGTIAALAPALATRLKTAVRDGAAAIIQRVKADAALKTRTGNYARALLPMPIETDGYSVTGGMYVDLNKAKYGAIQEFGGTIRPVHGRYLTIPIGDALTGNGVARFTARGLIENPQAFGFLRTFFYKHVLFGDPTKGGQMVRAVPLFVLKSSVTLPARHPVQNAADAERPGIEARIAEAVAEATQEANRG